MNKLKLLESAHLRQILPRNKSVQRLGEVVVLLSAVGTAHRLAVVGGEVEPLLRMYHQVVARRAL